MSRVVVFVCGHLPGVCALDKKFVLRKKRPDTRNQASSLSCALSGLLCLRGYWSFCAAVPTEAPAEVLYKEMSSFKERDPEAWLVMQNIDAVFVSGLLSPLQDAIVQLVSYEQPLSMLELHL